MPYKLSDLIDVPRLQELMDVFYTVTDAPSAILDADGTILTASAWQDICTKYHRVNPLSEERCKQSDAYIATHLTNGQSYTLYECANGLVDVASPIMVDGQHVGTVFTGQFLLHEPDTAVFRRQAQEFGFDENGYMQALTEVPIVQRDKIEPILKYLALFTSMVAEMGLQRMNLLESQRVAQQAQGQTLRMGRILDNSFNEIYIFDAETLHFIQVNSGARNNIQYTMEELTHLTPVDIKPDIDAAQFDQVIAPLRDGTRTIVTFQTRHQRKDGSTYPVNVRLHLSHEEDPPVYAAIIEDMSERQAAEAERVALQEQVIAAQQAALREISTPLIPITDTVVIMPLVGTIDSTRAQQVLETLLEGVAHYQAELAILDITGVQIVDTQVAQALIQAAQAVKLLGARVMLTGIQPQIAQTLVHLGVDLSGIRTQGTLQAGIAHALRL